MADQAQYLGPIDLPTYFILNTTIKETVVPPDDTNAIEIEITFGRRLFSTILTNYVPTFLICFLCFTTNYFKPFFFEAIVAVNLVKSLRNLTKFNETNISLHLQTSMLTLTTLFISITESLPKTSYPKMMDIWLLFCLMVPLLEVILQVFNLNV